MSVLSFHRGERAQSLVELALVLPILLLVLVGLADVGRVYYYATSVASAAREGAVFAARNTDATLQQVATRACDELGYANPPGCPSHVDVDTVRGSDTARGSTECLRAAGSAQVMVTYRLDLISGDLARRFFRTGPAPVRGVACVPELTR